MRTSSLRSRKTRHSGDDLWQWAQKHSDTPQTVASLPEPSSGKLIRAFSWLRTMAQTKNPPAIMESPQPPPDADKTRPALDPSLHPF